MAEQCCTSFIGMQESLTHSHLSFPSEEWICLYGVIRVFWTCVSQIYFCLKHSIFFMHTTPELILSVFCIPIFRQFLFVVTFTTFLFNCVEYDVLFANRVVNHTGQSLGPLDRNKVTLPDAILPGEQCTERSVCPLYTVLCTCASLSAFILRIEFSFACSNLLVTLNFWFI